ncbi:hypothetical protein COCC4DRAFT_65959 [Bipolaris maydis ATCC 48331]|uniref:FAD dependent oxidoreductase domain-containing protein n=2 Tax=Cochliobolus heterostrophus TaxID=5016 RepID=M2V1L3_COCH5|nr:uncharacterized protein COCC4DRAFT_65959 [Bipolaris maydis ATCC 48331]EMD93827.1 hypothetical protein COCHEDRAFT_1172016 [Bipolaris maydis C5]KAJ5028098.1 FAD dependent oxidoreductase-domain-containing protein [Bipolaris maydis]ENH99877.1 hypothetical protein COCC4DRAFT_65959 [Bipolaris maydis ATCC 48331]KAJ5062874.1 FAD dependent oxidoreductase-domain-containing protein [Bipolaris maydis]KAJ6199147.1 FAD dependent oxidoreductase-domain-containing protein [Bipolaris maydis]
MGVVLSTLQGLTKICVTTASLLKALSTEFNQALKRASQSPGLPSPNPTQTYWLNDPPYPELVNASSPSLPQTTDVAIIGSGIAGASVARSLLHERRRSKTNPDEKVVVLEARQLCSGATARNGGHIKPSPYECFSLHSKLFSKDRATALVRFQSLHIDYLTGLCEIEGIEAAQARKVETVDFFLDNKSFSKAVADSHALKQWLPEIDIVIWNGDEAQKRFGINESVVGALSYKAGAIWPYRFVTSIWNSLLNEFPHLSVETDTPVESISVPEDAPAGFPYALKTPRGTIFARKVVHTTNAFASHLVPGLRSRIVGARAHMSAQTPGQRFPHADGTKSWGVIYDDAFDYITQIPPASGEDKGDLMIGGGFKRSLKQGIDQVGLYDDGSVLDPLTITHIAGIFPAIFHPKWGAGSELKQMWPGIIGLTGDSLPFVGRLNAKLTGRDIKKRKGRSDGDAHCGEWIAAGFCGEGMVWAWLSGAALGIMIAGTEEDDLPEDPGRPGGKLAEWFPHELLISDQRLRSANISNLVD